MTARSTLAIVGASLAGAKAAEGARAAGFDGRILLIGDEQHPAYERPPLSKAVLRGEAGPDTTRVHPDGFYEEHDIDVVTEEVNAIDPAGRRLRLRSGAQIPFDSLVLATGAAPRRLDVPGGDLDGVYCLRTVDDAARLRDAIRSTTRVVVVGAGWIGSEVAASARQMGADVVLVDPGPAPLRRVVGDEVGAMFTALHADHGVTLRMGSSVRELGGAGRVEHVVLSDGRVEVADVVVAGIGVTPRVELAEASLGVRVDNGVVVGEHLESTVPGIFAAGDVANAWHPHYRRYLRVEHWANALNQGLTAGRNAAGQREVYARLPYFFSDQYDLGLEYVGHSSPDDALLTRGDIGSRVFVAFWHRDGVVTAAMAVNVWDVVDDLKAIVESGTRVDLRKLASSDVPLTEISGAVQGRPG
jgi:3-phenylpropionate/trans-cinnamate dioxygenase ferredoxin reductase subunit